MTATCPNGKTSIYHMTGGTRRSTPNVHFNFSAAIADPVRFAQNALTQRQGTEPDHLFEPPVQDPASGSSAAGNRSVQDPLCTAPALKHYLPAVNAMEIRFARYHGEAKTHLQNLATAAAINLLRVAHWLMVTGHTQPAYPICLTRPATLNSPTVFMICVHHKATKIGYPE